jgi:pantetheine-phosphate adenylyltransferase
MNMSDRIKLGLYCGSFNPFTVGHLDIVKQAVSVFDEVMVAKGINPAKEQTYKYPLPIKFLNNMNVHVMGYRTLVTDFIQKLETDGYDVTLIRGLRNGADLEYEQNFTAFLKDIYPKVKLVAFYCDPKFRHISSSSVRDIEKFSPEEYKKYIVVD